MELEMLIIFSSVGLIIATVLWLTLPSELPDPIASDRCDIWTSLDQLTAPHREEPASIRRVNPGLLVDGDR
jgi:hypothetical protein